MAAVSYKTMVENIKQVQDYLTKSNLPASDYVINPYIGCPHACQYCYARFMKRFTNHKEAWGSFIDIKECAKPINLKKLSGKSLFLSSVTDCYNPYEEHYKITRSILEQLVDADCSVTISTKSSLIVRDIDLLTSFKNLKVSISINTLDEAFQADMDKAGSITERLEALKELHKHKIHTVLFMSPIFPYITDFKQIIEETKDYITEYWFENLNLRGDYKASILSYISEKYPHLYPSYQQNYLQKDLNYWKTLSHEISAYCSANHIAYENYFYHNLLVSTKKISNREKRHITTT